MTMRRMRAQHVLLTFMVVCLSLLAQPSSGFFAPLSSTTRKTTAPSSIRDYFAPTNHHAVVAFALKNTVSRQSSSSPSSSTTRLHYFNSGNGMPPLLPPENKNKIDWKVIGTSVLSILGVIVFFASPLGGIVFSIFNSLLLLSFLLPFVGVVAFQIWQAFNTLEGACPACGAPIRVVKNNDSSLQPDAPGICFNCGSIVQATLDNQGIELVQGGPGIPEPQQEGGAFWDSWFGDGSGGEETIITTTTTTTTSNNKGDRYRRENTVIDVDVEPKDRY